MGSSEPLHFLMKILLPFSHENLPEIWREYVGYGLDLDLPSIVPSPDLVSNGNDYMELIDGNLATCVQPNMTSCGMEMKVSP